MSLNSQISGPVSMYYLKPNDSSLPLFLLFGDIHNSFDNMCSECTCEERKRCCHRIYDIDFLKKIEKLSRPQRPVDFYIEYFEADDDGAFESPLDHFREPNFRNCYRRTVKNRKNCYAPDIRWHYSDIRMAHTKNNIENLFESLYVFIQFCMDLNKTQSYEGISMSHWLKMDKSSLTYKKVAGIDISKKEDIYQIIKLLAEFNQQTIAEFAERIVDFVFTSEYPSLIQKQFRKQVKTSIFADKSFVVKMMRDSLQSKLAANLDVDDKLFDKLAKFDITANYKPLAYLLLHINSTFVDLYTILRAMKKNDTPPALCVAYLGNAHILNMVDILLSTDYYQVEASVEENDENRCLPFDIFDDLRKSLSKRSSSRTARTGRKFSSKSKSKLYSSM